MFERYTESGRRAVFFARYRASQAGAREIRPHHILLGIAHESNPRLERLFQLRGRYQQLKSEVEAGDPSGKPLEGQPNIPLDDPAKRVLAYAVEEAESLGHLPIEPEHLLLGLLREKDSIAARTLDAMSINLEDARKKVSSIIPDTPPPTRSTLLSLLSGTVPLHVRTMSIWTFLMCLIGAFVVGFWTATLWFLR